jgi:hypothetical protein
MLPVVFMSVSTFMNMPAMPLARSDMAELYRSGPVRSLADPDRARMLEM